MQINRKRVYWGILAWAGSLVLSNAVTGRVTRSHLAAAQAAPQGRSAQRMFLEGENPASEQLANAAFRDGLFQGKLSAARGCQPHVTTGRWVTESARLSFAAGYLQGYRANSKYPAAIEVGAVQTE